VADAHQMGWDGALGKLPISAAPGRSTKGTIT